MSELEVTIPWTSSTEYVNNNISVNHIKYNELKIISNSKLLSQYFLHLLIFSIPFSRKK